MFWVPTTGRALDLRDLAYSFQTFCELWDFRGGSEGVSYLPKVTRLKSSRTRIGTQMRQGGKGRVWGTFRVTNGGRPSRRHGVSPLQPGALPVPYHPPPPVSPREGWESLQLLLQTGHWGPGSKLVLHLPGDDITPRNGQFANPAWPPPHLHTDPILPVGKGREGTSRHLCIPQGELKTQRGACLARGHTANRCRAGTEPASMCQSGALPGSQGAGEPPAPYRVTQPPQAENADPPLPTFLPPPPLSAHLPLSATPCSSHGCCPAAPLFPDLGDSVVLLLHPVFDDADQRADVVELRFLQDPWHRQRPASLPLPPLPCSPLPPPPPPNPPPAPVTRG